MRGMFKNTPNPTRFKVDIENRLMNLKIDFDEEYEDDYVDEDYESSEKYRMFRQMIIGVYK